MGDKHFLKHFITDPIYIIDEPQPIAETSSEAHPIPEIKIASGDNAPETAPLNIQGKPDSDLLIIINQPGDETLELSGQALLQKILQAVNRSLESSALINYAQHPDLNTDQLNALPAKYRLYFGNDLKVLTGNATPYQIQTVNSSKVLVSDNLAALQQDVKKKKLLWVALQEIFK